MSSAPRRKTQSRDAARVGAKDVARLAGVSTATVSRALNLPAQVDPATRARVHAAVDQLRYVPHGAARALRSQRSGMIGAVVPSFDYALYSRTTSALEAVLDECGYSLVLAAHHYDLATEVRVTQKLIEHGVDALAFVGLDHDPALYDMLNRYGQPYVLTWGVDASRRHPSIGFDNRAATFELTRYLIDLGHRHFGLLSAPTEGNDRSRERGAGVRHALSAAGLSLPDAWTVYGPIALEAGRRGMLRLMSAKKRPTAVIATNDVFAVGAMLACRENGIRVPDDVSITGVDNTDLGATQTPALTSIRTPIVDVGRAAALQLIQRLDGHATELFQELPVKLMKRGSTAAPPRTAILASKR